MKVLIIITLLFAGKFSCQAQSFDEWFRQKKTQKKYLLEQIAALKIYQGYLSKGYEIVKDGLGTIKKIKSGEFGLHDLYFESLKYVNPVVAGSSKIKDILRLQIASANIGKRTLQNLKKTQLIKSDEKQNIQKAFSRLADDCNDTLDELTDVIISGRLEMTDEQRLKRIESLHGESLSQYQFAKKFKNVIILLLASRQLEQTDISQSRLINGIK